MARLEVLWCERGGHQWRRPVRPGRPPNSCPEHAHVLDERLVRYPDEDKPLAPRFLAPLLDVPVTRFYFGPMPPDVTRLADLDLETSGGLRPAARRQLARAVHETVRERWRTVGHHRPFADLPEAIDILKLPIGTNTRNCLSAIPAGYLGEMDVGALFGIRGFGPKSLLDVTSAIDAVGHRASEGGSPVDGEILSATEDALLLEDAELVEPVEAEVVFRRARRLDPMASLPLDVVVQGRPMARPGLWLTDHWDDLSASALPEPARGVVLAGGTAQDVLAALVDPAAVEEGAHQLLNDLRGRLGVSSRRWEVTLERSGFGTDAAVTLAAIGDRMGITRERVRQLALPISALWEQVRPHDPLALSLQAWFALNPGRPLRRGRLAELCSSTQVERAALLVLDGLRFPYLDRGDRYWVPRGDELRALSAVAGRTNLADESVAGEAVEKTASELPGVERVLDLAYVVNELTTPETHSRVAHGGPVASIPSGLGGSLVRKIVTYLVNRAAPVDVDELAGVIEAGHWPFEVLDLTTIDPAYLRTLARAHPDLLSCSDDDRIDLGSARVGRSPSGNVGAIHRILSDAGGPLSTARLKELAAQRGIGANTLGVLVHGNRAPCVIPVARGMVGLVGRDEHWAPYSSDSRPDSPADDPRCFFLPEGWAVKLQVDRELLRGGSWEVPPPLADHLGFRRRRVVRLTSEEAGFAALLLEPKVHSCIGRSLEAGLHSVGAAHGDTVFVVLGAGVYKLLLRGQAESEERDPLRQLVAGCGLDPDSTIASDPWSRVARALGATGTSRQAVRGRLQLRGQVDMLKLVDAAQLRRGRTGPEIWPGGWSYIAPLDDDPSRYAVRSSQGALRVAVGVLRGAAVPDFAIVGESGLVWIDVGEAEASERARLAAAARTTPDAAWVRWARAEHAARRVALSGEHWEIIIEPRGYAVAGALHDDLAAALEAVGTLTTDAEPVPPSQPARNGYPRGALAFAQAVRGARRNGLLRLVADADAGFGAAYPGERFVRGPTLADVLSLASSSTT